MIRKFYMQFHHGKGISKSALYRKPMKWFPWTYIDTYNPDTGRFRPRRKFGYDGWAYKDLDTPDNHNPYDYCKQNKSVRSLKKRKRKERRHFETICSLFWVVILFWA